MQHPLRFPTFLLGSTLLLFDVSAVRATSFSSEALWRAAAPGFVLETFEGIAAGTQVSSLAGLGVSFDFLNDGVTHPSVQSRVNTGGFAQSGVNVFLNDIDFALPGRGPINIRPLNPGDAIFALGYWNTGGDDTTFLSFFDQNNVLIETVESSQTGGTFNFNGIVNATPAFRVEIAPGSLGNGYFTLDDLQVVVNQVGQVPEPSSLALFTLSLLGLTAFSSRRNGRK